MHRRRIACAAAACGALGGVPAAVQAGTYDVHSCRLPDGKVAPARGWMASASGATAVAADTCAGGEFLRTALLPQAQPSGAKAEYVLKAAAGTRFVRWEYDREASSGLSGPASAAVIWGTAAADREVVTGGKTSAGVAVREPLDAQALSFNAACGTPGCPAQNPQAEMRLRRSAVRVSDDSAPVADPATGTLTAAGALKGSVNVAIAARDSGGGLFAARLLVDGTQITSGRFAPLDGPCADLFYPSPGRDVVDALPCPLSGDVRLIWDTTKVADGKHTVTVNVDDIAANKTDVFGPTEVTVLNNPLPPVPNGTPATREAALTLSGVRRGRLRRSFGTMTISGRLTARAGGAAIAGARVTVAAAGAGGASERRAETVTDARGRFRARLTSGVVSGAVTASYRAFSVADPPDATGSARLAVTYRPRLSVNRRRLPSGGRVRLSGRLPALAAGRARVALEGQVGRRFQVFRVVRVGRSGRWSGSYRFGRQPLARRFRLRARVLRESTVPLTFRPSQARTVVVGG